MAVGSFVGGVGKSFSSPFGVEFFLLKAKEFRLKAGSDPDVGQGIMAAQRGKCPQPPSCLSVNYFDGTD